MRGFFVRGGFVRKELMSCWRGFCPRGFCLEGVLSRLRERERDTNKTRRFKVESWSDGQHSPLSRFPHRLVLVISTLLYSGSDTIHMRAHAHTHTCIHPCFNHIENLYKRRPTWKTTKEIMSTHNRGVARHKYMWKH